MTDNVTTAPTMRRVSTTSITRPDWVTQVLAIDRTTPIALSLMGSVLCIAIGLIHIQDQGGLLGNQSPHWLAIGYYAIEIAAGITALLLARQHVLGWVFALGVSAAPATGYILSRTVGVPGDPGDIGNWGYTLGTVSLIVEGALFAIAVLALGRAIGQWRGVRAH
jgi:hypothetical protein